MRDIVAGVVLVVIAIWAEAKLFGYVLLIFAAIPAGDMSIILAAKGSTGRALGIHGFTAIMMIIASVFTIFGVA